jgi:hypothetical protein
MIFSLSDCQRSQIFPSNCADCTRWLDARTSVSGFRVFYAVKMGVIFYRFGYLKPRFSGVEHLVDKHTGEITDTEYDVQDVFYSVHIKRGAGEDDPRTILRFLRNFRLTILCKLPDYGDLTKSRRF